MGSNPIVPHRYVGCSLIGENAKKRKTCLAKKIYGVREVATLKLRPSLYSWGAIYWINVPWW